MTPSTQQEGKEDGEGAGMVEDLDYVSATPKSKAKEKGGESTAVIEEEDLTELLDTPKVQGKHKEGERMDVVEDLSDLLDTPDGKDKQQTDEDGSVTPKATAKQVAPPSLTPPEIRPIPGSQDSDATIKGPATTRGLLKRFGPEDRDESPSKGKSPAERRKTRLEREAAGIVKSVVKFEGY